MPEFFDTVEPDDDSPVAPPPVLPSTKWRASALQTVLSMLDSSAHIPRYRRFTTHLAVTRARLAERRGVTCSFAAEDLHLLPTHQFAWRSQMELSFPDSATTRSIEGKDGPAITVGLDVGDRYTHIHALGASGAAVRERRVRTTTAALSTALTGLPRSRAVLEAGPRSPWLSRVVAELGHEVVVANPRQVALIARSQRKTDRLDAEWLARLGRFDPKLLAPIRHRSERSQHDLAVVRARDALVRTRTLLINHVRGAVKACGAALPSCTAEAFHRKMAEHIPAGLRPALLPLVEAVGELTARIAQAGREVEALCEAHPETRALRQVTGVGPITALTFVLTIEDAGRFPQNREVGAYLGLVPRQRESGERAPQLGIAKSGDAGLRRLLVQAAHYILGPFGPDTDLRRWGERYAAAGAGNAKKRAVVAVARRLAVLLLALWKTGEAYEPLRHAAAREAA